MQSLCGLMRWMSWKESLHRCKTQAKNDDTQAAHDF